MKWFVVPLLLVASPAISATAYGIAFDSCAVSMERSEARNAWILGFWSGLNVAIGADVGKTTDAMGIIAEVERFCSENPTVSMGMATAKVYVSFENAGR